MSVSISYQAGRTSLPSSPALHLILNNHTPPAQCPGECLGNPAGAPCAGIERNFPGFCARTRAMICRFSPDTLRIGLMAEITTSITQYHVGSSLTTSVAARFVFFRLYTKSRHRCTDTVRGWLTIAEGGHTGLLRYAEPDELVVWSQFSLSWIRMRLHGYGTVHIIIACRKIPIGSLSEFLF
ncbi:hypothetical protein B0H11DRAFT_1937108 [Mycena galericulata]|nr:hypothetical protein B0H11DRAFT_1937108 [Mycena galericulata]